jgi:poly-D-alanine transfer protein DltD
MAKRRYLKREIDSVAGELFAEVLMVESLTPGVDSDKVNALLDRILEMQEKFISKVNGRDNKDSAKQYFKQLHTELQTEVDSIADEIGKLSGKGAEA